MGMLCAPVLSIATVLSGSVLAWRFESFDRSDMISICLITTFPSLILNVASLVIVSQTGGSAMAGPGLAACMKVHALVIVLTASLTIAEYMPLAVPIGLKV
eukprot:581482_1